MPQIKDIIDQQKIFRVLKETSNPNSGKVLEILNKSLDKKGLSLKEVGYLVNAENPKLIRKMFNVAHKIKWEIYGERLVFFAPLYVSSFCVNDCEYCGFHRRNSAPRTKLSLKEVQKQVKILEDMGHKRLLLEFGEHPRENSIDYVVDVIKTVYKTKSGLCHRRCLSGRRGFLGQVGEIRRVNVNIAATTVENYRKLKAAGIGTYQLFQETYHKETYDKMHNGPKADYERQLFAHDRAFEAGIDDVGIGVLFGLYDWRFEVLALVSHAKYLDKKFGVGPHTISIPRWQPADSVSWKEAPYPVSEDEFLKIIAVLRMAVPYTGMIISTRERPEIRAKAFEIGISQTSAASRTSPGGYIKNLKPKTQNSKLLSQFSLADHRSLDEVLKSILKQNLLPSFCTACYRLGRTGRDFMNFAKPGNIQNFCRPNAILTFKEYLEDYASERVRKVGLKIIDQYLEKIPKPSIINETKKRLCKIERGERDIYF